MKSRIYNKSSKKFSLLILRLYMYSDEDIDVAYELLLGLIEILITVEEQLQEQYCVDEM